MNFKHRWLAVAIFVCLFCASVMANDNPWDDFLQPYQLALNTDSKNPVKTTMIRKDLSPASPLDFCSNTNPCVDTFIWCQFPGSVQPGVTFYAFQDPAQACPPNPLCPVYPFLVDNIVMMMTPCGPESCIVTLQPSIVKAKYPSGPLCPEPDLTQPLCTGNPVNILLQPFSFKCYPAVMPLDTGCCVDSPYFAVVQVVSINCFGPQPSNIQICVDDSCAPCCSYMQVPGQLVPQDLCFPPPGGPGNLAIYTTGFKSCQNQCAPPPPPVDTLRNHFKTWRIFTPQPVDTFALVRDQFTIHDFLFVDSIDFLSNPVRKIVFGAAVNDTSDIIRPDDHLTWYRVKSSNNRRINVQVTYVNQFESTKVFIDTVKYFLLPTQKLFPSHPRPDSLLGHYTAYRIHKPKGFMRPVQLDDQFDQFIGLPELIDSLVPKYFLTPAQKEFEPVFGPDTHYVAYQIFPQTLLPALSTQTIDQWGQHQLQVRNSEYLLVPSRKDTFVVCTHKPNDCNGNGTVDLADIICDVNVVFKGFPKPVPDCRCNSNCDAVCNLVDIVYKKNYVFGGGPKPVPCKQCCIPVDRVP